MKSIAVSINMLLASMIYISGLSAQSDCKDIVKEQYFTIIKQYFGNLNEIRTIKGQYEKTEPYKSFKALFESEKTDLPQDFIHKSYNRNLADNMSIGNYVLEFRKYWGGNEEGFQIPEYKKIYCGKIKNEYVFIFDKAIDGIALIKEVPTPDEISTLQTIEMIFNPENKKIKSINIITNRESVFNADNDDDRVLDIWQGYECDLCRGEKGYLTTDGCKDSDCDQIKDEEDECDMERGPRCTKGCPDGDDDCVTDSKDENLKVKGTIKCLGDLDSDGDGVCDYKDKCNSTYGKKRNGCLRESKPYLLSIKPSYGMAIPLGSFASSKPLVGVDYNWEKEAGFASRTWNSSFFGLSLDVYPFRHIGFVTEWTYWNMPLSADIFGKNLNTYYSRRVPNYDITYSSTQEYKGLLGLIKIPLGYFEEKFSIKLEPTVGYSFRAFSGGDLGILIALRNQEDVSTNITLVPERMLVKGINLACSVQLEWNERLIGLDLRVGYLEGALPKPSSIQLLPATNPILVGANKFQMLGISLGANISLFESNNQNY